MIQKTRKEKQGSKRPRTYQSDTNIEAVEKLILIKKSDPGTYTGLIVIELQTEIPRASVHWMAKFDFDITLFKLTNIQRLRKEKGYCAT